MDINIANSWQLQLAEEFEKPYFKELISFVDKEYETEVCFPKKEEIFHAFLACDFEKVKVVLIGQDPYHDVNQANGLCFSVAEGMKHPPSLVNIFKELQTDLEKEIPVSGDLSHWAEQGVLLLNATLTVRAHTAGSHQKQGWESFTDAVIKKLSEEREDLVFLLWGGFAKKKGKKIDRTKHCVLESGHPSPLSANRGYWFGNKCFSETNAYLASKGLTKINW
ncbi:uracil-DNA glycosylase [Flavicella sediminum]|uniref:uracil-DNA glycosylase n=1 Tax=Flavicella sediminum TaxID=2585141 RepID=UPI00111E05D7|nr:uracil-DNA glycosylase [Flavicella sediminum]